MLLKLSLKNIVLISDAEIEFESGFNVLTGETGAGKSILIDGLLLLLGGRFDKSLLKFGESEAMVKGVFLLNSDLQQELLNLGLEKDDVAIVSRKFYIDGKSETRINGHIVTASMLKMFSARLMDIYGQRDYAQLADNNEQLRIFDYYDRHKQQGIKDELAKKYDIYIKTKNVLKELGDSFERERNIDFIKYQIQEIESANIQENEEEQLVLERKQILNANRILESLNSAAALLEKNNTSEVLQKLNSIIEFNEKYYLLAKRLESTAIELDDVLQTVYSEGNLISFDEDSLDVLEQRLSLVRHIKRKYGDYDKLCEYKKTLKAKLDYLENSDEIYQKNLSEMLGLKKDIYLLCKNLSDLRKKAATEFEQKINLELAELGMQAACFKIDFANFPDFEDCEQAISPCGMDKIDFLISTNPGQPFLSIMKVMSGGEISRFCLALKIVSGDNDSIPTLIFDEIDNGISGKVGQEVAKKLARLAKNHQILCVTHLPQIAAMASAHFFVDKNVSENKAVTLLSKLDLDGMIQEISRLSGGINISDKSILNASEIKNWSDNYKKSI